MKRHVNSRFYDLTTLHEGLHTVRLIDLKIEYNCISRIACAGNKPKIKNTLAITRIN